MSIDQEPQLFDRKQMSYLAAQAADARVNIELEAEGMTLNVGPHTLPLTELYVSC